ncbi:unnamed protein product [Choristocarpus tenellus]
MVSRTLTVWKEDGGCLVKIANLSQKGIKLPAEFVVGHVSPVSKTYILSDTTVSAVAATPSTFEELKQAREEFKLVFSKKAFTNTQLTLSEQEELLDIVAKFRPVFSLSEK